VFDYQKLGISENCAGMTREELAEKTESREGVSQCSEAKGNTQKTHVTPKETARRSEAIVYPAPCNVGL
jgi:hypothetical protein